MTRLLFSSYNGYLQNLHSIGYLDWGYIKVYLEIIKNLGFARVKEGYGV